MKIDESTRNALVVEQDRVIIYDSLGEDVIWDQLEYSEIPERVQAFQELFEIVEPRRYWMANPNEDFYQGIEVMIVIRRKSDSRLFGFNYWTPVSKHGEAQVESNGDSNGFDWDIPDDYDWNEDYYPNPYVFLPVEPFTITGYKIEGK